MTVTEEPNGRYLTHYTPDKTTIEKPGKHFAIGLFNCMKDRGIYACLEVISCNIKNDMSGWKAGMLNFVEELLNRRLYRSFCCIHINELPFRHIMEIFSWANFIR